MIDYKDNKIFVYSGSNVGRSYEIEVKVNDLTADLIFPGDCSFHIDLDDKITCDVILRKINLYNKWYDKMYCAQHGDAKRLDFIKKELSISGLGYEWGEKCVRVK